jgi:hypothetical protein|tara:strand:- start:397 stop:786 length:390 start_codon:yes stop_codon:yes gene_type:complete
MSYLASALKKLKPDHTFRVLNGTQLIWEDERPQPTEAEIQAKIKELEAEEPMRLLRLERNRRLTAVDWWTSRALDGTALTEAQKTYRQQLRDLPKMITPDDSSEPLPAPTIDENGQLVFDHWPEYNEDK